MDIQTYLGALGQHLNIDDLRLDKHKVCRIAFNGGFDVFIEPGIEPYTIHLYAVLGSLPLSSRESFYEAVFEKNLFGKHTGEMQICCDVKAEEVLLYYRYHQQQMNVDYFIQIFDQFVTQFNEQEAWLAQGVFQTSTSQSTMSENINPALLI